jgi:dTDP-4-dehydrorhamnose reductase
MDKRIMVIGASGFLGSRVYASYSNKASVLGTFNSNSLLNLKQLDAANMSKVSEMFDQFRPQVVINASGFTNVDSCEKWPELAWRENVESATNLAIACFDSNAKYIQISTDHFDSPVTGLRGENCSPLAVNYYGYTKLTAEKMIMKAAPDSLIIRTNFFGIGKRDNPSFLNWIVDGLVASKTISAVTDVFFTPVSVGALIDLLWDLISTDTKGIINISSNESISKFSFIQTVANVLEIDEPHLVPVRINEIGLKAVRPLQMSLANDRLCELFDIQIPNIASMIEREVEAMR